jgi:hypothetical protein
MKNTSILFHFARLAGGQTIPVRCELLRRRESEEAGMQEGGEARQGRQTEEGLWGRGGFVPKRLAGRNSKRGGGEEMHSALKRRGEGGLASEGKDEERERERVIKRREGGSPGCSRFFAHALLPVASELRQPRHPTLQTIDLLALLFYSCFCLHFFFIHTGGCPLTFQNSPLSQLQTITDVERNREE